MEKPYILKHQTRGFTGMCGHVWFENGRGATSSETDAKDCVRFGCKNITEEHWTKKAKEEALVKAREAKKAKDEAKKKGKEEAKEEKEPKAEEKK